MAFCQRMTGKRVLVTGSGTGIGKEVALEFCREGAEVVFHYSGSREGAMSAVRISYTCVGWSCPPLKSRGERQDN